MQKKAIDLKTLFALQKENKDLPTSSPIFVEGWVRTNRNSGKIGFIELHDGTCFKSIQIVYSSELANFDEISHFNTGSSISVTGNLVLTPGMRQPFEIQALEISQIGFVADDYPLQKKRHSLEFLRDEAYLRPRTNTFDAVFRVRSVLAMGIHTYFQDRGFVYVHTPEITANDAEGAGSVFTLTTDGKDPYNEFLDRKSVV